jgi:hypothetical protein
VIVTTRNVALLAQAVERLAMAARDGVEPNDPPVEQVPGSKHGVQSPRIHARRVEKHISCLGTLIGEPIPRLSPES